MAIDSVNNSAISQLLYSPSTSTSTSASGSSSDADGSANGTSVGSTTGAAAGGRFASAISLALTQIGVTPANASSASGASTAATQDPTQAAQAFASALFGALHAQDSSTGASNGAPKAAGGHHHGGGGGGKIESGMQNLIQTLSAGGASTSGGGASTSTSGGSDLSKLQTAFDNMVAANGGTAGNASLTSFLQNLAQDMQGAPSTGNVVSTNV